MMAFAKSRVRTSLTLALGLAFALSWSQEASAFCRKRAIPPAVRKKFAGKVDKFFTDKCEDDQLEEFAAYPWIYWPNACTSFSVSTTLAGSLSVIEASALTALSFSQWSGTRCPGVNGDSRPSIDIRDLGQAGCATVGYDTQGGPNQNLIIYQDKWDTVLGSKVTQSDADILGLTTVSYDDTGRILDADMRLNMQIAPAVKDPVATEAWDLRSIVTHEFGHFLGFAHSGDPSAIMYYTASTGETNKRYLAEDDRKMVCETYKPGGTRAIDPTQNVAALPCDPTPANGYTQECQAAASKCSATPYASEAGSAAFAAAGAIVALLAARRAQRRCT